MGEMYPGLTTSLLLEEGPVGCVRALAGAGWPAVELSTEHLTAIDEADESERLTDELREAVDELGMRMPQAHLMISADVAALDEQRRSSDLATVERHIELCARMGITAGVIHPGGAQVGTLDQWRRQGELRVEGFRHLAEVAAGHGVRIAVENTMDSGPDTRAAMGRRRYGATIVELNELIDAVDAPNVGICLDTGHSNVQGIPLDEAVRQCGPRLIALHVQDNNGVADQHYAPPRGTIHWSEGVAALREVGYEGIFNFEVGGERGMPTEQTLARARAILETARWLLAQ